MTTAERVQLHAQRIAQIDAAQADRPGAGKSIERQIIAEHLRELEDEWRDNPAHGQIVPSIVRRATPEEEQRIAAEIRRKLQAFDRPWGRL